MLFLSVMALGLIPWIVLMFGVAVRLEVRYWRIRRRQARRMGMLDFQGRERLP